MAVRVEGRHEKQGHAFEDAFRCFSAQQFAQGDEARVLAVAFSRVDASLKQEQGHAATSKLGRLEAPRSRHQKRSERPALGRASVLERARRLGPLAREGVAKAFDFIKATGFLETGRFGEGQ